MQEKKGKEFKEKKISYLHRKIKEKNFGENEIEKIY